MEVMWPLWEIAVNCMECGSVYYLLATQLGVPNKKRTYLLLIGLIAAFSIMNLCSVHFAVVMGIMFVLTFLYALTFGSPVPKRFLWGGIGACLPFVTHNLVTLVLTWIPGADITQTVSPGTDRFMTMLLYCLIVFALSWALTRIRVREELLLPRRYQFLMAGILGLALFATTQALAFAFQSSGSAGGDVLLSALSVSVLLMTASVIYLFERIGEATAKRMRMEAELSQMRLEEENARHTQQIVRAWRHDFHNHTEVLQYHLERQDYSEAIKYLGEVKRDYQQTLPFAATGNATLDAILFSKQLIAQDQTIHINLQIAALPELPLGETEICVLFGNLLDNAIEACGKIEDVQLRYITLHVNTHRGMLRIQVENSATGHYAYEGNKLISSKAEKNHGYGLARVQQIVEKANGVFSIYPAADCFKVTLLLPLKEAVHAD